MLAFKKPLQDVKVCIYLIELLKLSNYYPLGWVCIFLKSLKLWSVSQVGAVSCFNSFEASCAAYFWVHLCHVKTMWLCQQLADEQLLFYLLASNLTL